MSKREEQVQETKQFIFEYLARGAGERKYSDMVEVLCTRPQQNILAIWPAVAEMKAQGTVDVSRDKTGHAHKISLRSDSAMEYGL